MIWLSVKETAKLLGYVDRNVRRKAKQNEYKYQYIPSSTGRGGKKMEILLESLPEQVQKAYHNEKGDYQTVVNTDYTYTKAQREKGIMRSQAIADFKKYRKDVIKSGVTSEVKIKDDFILKWNKEHPEFQRSRKTFYDWLSKSKRGDVEKLVDRRGGYNRGKSSISEEYQKFFLDLYLQETKPTLASCYQETKILANSKGVIIPGIKAFQNLVHNTDYAIIVRLREGKKAFQDKCEPYTERRFDQIEPNEWWVSDHHLWDIFVRVPDGKGGWKVGRPWGSYWMDMRTRKMMSSILRLESPNSDIVLCSFGLGVENFGIPKGVRLDNGKDYKAKDLFIPQDKYICSEQEEKDIFSSLATNLQITTTYAIPFRARSKPIERTFNTYEEQLGKKYPSYAGCNAKMRPEDLKDFLSDLNIMNCITLEEFIIQHNKYVYEIYNNSPHSGDAMYNQSPNHMYSVLEYNLRKVSKEVLYFSLMRVKGIRVVQRNGITFNGVHFYNDNVIKYRDKKVIAKYDPTKPEILYVFDMNENFLFIATQIKKQGFSLTKEDYQEENHRKKIARQVALNGYIPNKEIRSTENIAKRLDMLADACENPPEVESPTVIEPVRNAKLEETVRKINLSDLEREYESALQNQKDRKNEVNQRQQELAERFKKNMLDLAYNRQA